MVVPELQYLIYQIRIPQDKGLAVYKRPDKAERITCFVFGCNGDGVVMK
jgi:hypothetical protein